MIADGPAAELLAGGWYFATETARILGGAGGALLPEQGAALLAAREAGRVMSPSPPVGQVVADGVERSRREGPRVLPGRAR